MVEKLLGVFALQPQLMSSASDDDMKFVKHIRKIYQYMSQLDKQKQLEPKFGHSIEPLYKFFKENYDLNSDAISTVTSDYSGSVFKNSIKDKVSDITK